MNLISNGSMIESVPVNESIDPCLFFDSRKHEQSKEMELSLGILKDVKEISFH